MAELNISQKSGRRKVLSTRIDLTPMVDLGFLLITFFMMTTTLAKPKNIELTMPSKEGVTRSAYPEESTITLMPVKEHRVIYYQGAFSGNNEFKNCGIAGIREVLLSKKRLAEQLPASFSKYAHLLHVVIKPNDDCRYEDVIHLLDEMTIAGAVYTIVDIATEEKDMISGKFQ